MAERLGAGKYADDYLRSLGVFRTDLVGLWAAIDRRRSERTSMVAPLAPVLLEKGADYRIEFVPDPMC